MTFLGKTATGVFLTAMAISVLAFFGAATGQGSADRTVTITYDPAGDPSHPDTGPFIFDPYTLVVEHGASNVPIRLEIVTDGFSFPDDATQAIAIHPDDGNFKILGVGANNKQIMLLDFNRVEMSYKYDVEIINEGTGEVYRIDPRVENGGGGTTD